MTMKKNLSRKKILVGVIFLSAVILITYFGRVGYSVHQEIKKQWLLEAKPVPTRRISTQAPKQVPDGVKIFPYLAEVRAVLAINQVILIASDSGLGIVKAGKVEVITRANGLPGSGLSHLEMVNGKVLALSSEGLLALHGDWAAPVPTVEIERFFPADGATLVDLWTDGQTVLLLDNRGRVLQFAENRFGEIARATPDPTARLGLLNRQPVVGNAGGDLAVWEPKSEKMRSQSLWPKEVGERAVQAIAVDQQGLLVGTATALWRVDSLGATRLLDHFAVSAIAVWNDQIWVGGPAGEVRDLSGEHRISLGVPIHRLRPDGARLLIAANDGLFAADPSGAAVPLIAAEQLKPVPEGYLAALAGAGDRVLVGTLNRGLWALDPENPPAQPAALENLGINQIVPDGPNTWVATTNGLFQLDGGLKPVHRWTDKDGLPHRYVTSVVAENRRLIVGTSGGVAQITPGGIRAVDAFHGLAGNQVYCLAPFGRELAAGGLAGLTLLGGADGLTVRRNLNVASGQLPHNWVNALLPDEERLWVGTYGGGIVVLDAEGRAQPAAETAGVSINSGAALIVGNARFFGTLTKGLAASRDGRRWVFIDQPLLSPNVTALAATPGFLWVGGDRGLVRLPWDLLRRRLE